MTTENKKLSLVGSVSLGTGVMIGAGIFVLMGQVAELVGKLFPIVFIVGAVVTSFSAYSYVKFSNTYPSSGGVAKFLRKAYGPGTITGVFALLMYVSMVMAQSLVARTFGSYTLQLFDVPNVESYVPVLGVLLIATAFIINISGNKVIEKSANITAIVKVLGIAVLAIAGLAAGGFPSFSNIAGEVATGGTLVGGFIAASALAILAYKGFTTITNHGGDIVNPNRNVGYSIIISVAICTVIYVALALAVSSSLSVSEIVAAKNYALAEAAKPVFGQFGLWFTVIIAIVATVSGVIASVFSSSRLLGMLSMMKQVPELSSRFRNTPLIFTVTLAILLTIFFDLTRIAAIGAIFYLLMDIAVHWGLLRYLRSEVTFNPLIPMIAIALDVVILVTFVVVKFNQDPLIPLAALTGLLLIIGAERLFMRSHTDSYGDMAMDDGM